jgi:RimJ/RimL family protein N-acetyltransferase
MNCVPRHEYLLELQGTIASPPENASTRHPTSDDTEALAQLMPDAYLDTIDYEGETIVESREEVARYFAGTPLLDHSWLRVTDRRPVAACLVSLWAERDCPIVSYVVTAPAWKGKGLASDLLARSIGWLAAAGQRELRAVVTEGNLPSEAVFRKAGFRRV